MKAHYVTKLVIAQDNSEPVSDALASKVLELMQGFQDAKVLGNQSPVGDNAALRMAIVAIRYFHDFDGCAEAMDMTGTHVDEHDCEVCKYLA